MKIKLLKFFEQVVLSIVIFTTLFRKKNILNFAEIKLKLVKLFAFVTTAF